MSSIVVKPDMPKMWDGWSIEVASGGDPDYLQVRLMSDVHESVMYRVIEIDDLKNEDDLAVRVRYRAHEMWDIVSRIAELKGWLERKKWQD